jgi:hypothetical protein
MDRLGPVALVVGALAALPTVAGCDGKVIRLGAGSTSLDGGSCPHAQVPASQVLWIGDSWQLLPTGAEAHTDVRNLARAAGAIGPNDDYTIAATAAAPMIPPATKGGPTPVPTQYTAQEATATKVKVLIVDGGTWDTITNNNSATVNAVSDNFTQLLSTVASDGTVTAVIYFLMPELSNVSGVVSIPGVAELRPLLEQDCAASTVPCHFIDLQQLWTDPTAYTTSGNPPVPTAAGATVIADAIWSTMQTYCIAQ